MTDSSGNDTKYLLRLENGAWDTTATVYNGSVANNSPIMSQATTYNWGHACSQFCWLGSAYVTQSTQTTSLSDSGLQSQVQYNYTVPEVDLPGTIKQWDFGTSFSGAPTRETDYTYDTTGWSGAPGPWMLIASETTKDGSGNLLTQTPTITRILQPQQTGLSGTGPQTPEVLTSKVFRAGSTPRAVG